ncbi:MAG TPA: nucleotidyltransferase domain-containing protein [Thermomicrobiaceae bacterium]|nr:nucleotidyltransferase domain-containing protein [Thermomicrobiaceae bacterium]
MAEYDRPPTLEDLRARREETLRIAAARGASNVCFFGSVARGDGGPESDIDSLIDLERGRDLFDLGELILDLQEALGCSADVVEIWQTLRVADRIQLKAVCL